MAEQRARPSLYKISLLYLLSVWIGVWSGNLRAESLTIAVAANVNYAFQALANAFTSGTGIAVVPVIGSSGQLTAQIQNGAPYDIFLSADMEYPQKLYDHGMAQSPPREYARGALVLWTMGNIPLEEGLTALTPSSVRRVAVANPKLAPYGREALKALDFYHLTSKVKSKLVYGESIAMVNQYIVSQQVDAGLTAKSVVVAPAMQGRGRWIELPQESYTPIAQGVVILPHGVKSNLAAAKRFDEFLQSEQARTVLIQYGYQLP